MTTKVALVQINNSFSGQNYLPLAVGTLQAYAERHLDTSELEFALPLYKRLPIAEGVERLSGVRMAFFSTYVWNIRISLAIAARLKVREPETLIVFGGPQVPDRGEEFLREHSFVDIAAHGEGEKIFLAILQHGLTPERWEEIPGISWLDPAGAYHTTTKPPRIRELGDVPSPYLEDTFAPLMKAWPDERWIVLWETNRGCPFSCTFCDWGSATATKVHRFELDRLRQEVDWFASHRIEFIFCADANFGILPRDLDIAKYVAETKSRTSYPHALSVQNTKNATERAYQVQTVLAQAGLNKGVAISLQSTSDVTLEAIKRKNISSDSYAELQRRFTRDGVETYSDLILGLPGETYDSFVDGISALITGGQHNRIQFNNLSILPNAEMGDPEYQAEHGMQVVETKIINIHGSLAGEEEVYETQQLVVATNSMPREDWVRTRAICWMTALLYFDKVLQIPLTVVLETCEVQPREVLEHFMSEAIDDLPALARVRDFFLETASKIQGGAPEYVEAPEWLNIWWPADEYILIELVARNLLGTFYAEADGALNQYLADRGQELPADALHQAVDFNRQLLKLPNQTEDLTIRLDYNLVEFYQAALLGERPTPEQVPSEYFVDRTTDTWETFDDWCQKVIWWGNKKGAYLYGASPSKTELAGHF